MTSAAMQRSFSSWSWVAPRGRFAAALLVTALGVVLGLGGCGDDDEATPAGGEDDPQPSDEEAALARALGRRVADIARRLEVR